MVLNAKCSMSVCNVIQQLVTGATCRTNTTVFHICRDLFGADELFPLKPVWQLSLLCDWSVCWRAGEGTGVRPTWRRTDSPTSSSWIRRTWQISWWTTQSPRKSSARRPSKSESCPEVLPGSWVTVPACSQGAGRNQLPLCFWSRGFYCSEVCGLVSLLWVKESYMNTLFSSRVLHRPTLLFHPLLCSPSVSVFFVVFLPSDLSRPSWSGSGSAVICSTSWCQRMGSDQGSDPQFISSVRSWCCSRLDGCAGGAVGVGMRPSQFLLCLWLRLDVLFFFYLCRKPSLYWSEAR